MDAIASMPTPTLQSSQLSLATLRSSAPSSAFAATFLMASAAIPSSSSSSSSSSAMFSSSSPLFDHQSLLASMACGFCPTEAQRLHLLASTVFQDCRMAGRHHPSANSMRNWRQAWKQNSGTMICSISPSASREPVGDGGTGGSGQGGDGYGGGSGRGRDGNGDGSDDGAGAAGGIIGAFLEGWRARVRTDPQFPYKVLMEEVVGVGACVLGDMASRPNLGLNELDFVFCTLVVGSILNFSLMYLLAPTSAAGNASLLPGVFASCPSGHMFEPGAYSIIDRAGTFVFKGAVFAAVGFAAGLVGTAISTLLLQARKKMDPSFVPQNKPPPTVLNAATWALHMGLSSNLRYQALNGLEFALANVLNPAAFKASVVATRTLNNVIGGISFVLLARLTGSQKAGADSSPEDNEAEAAGSSS